ncbi:MAG TPA: (3R)-hydroxyacyl-ACP dehydratase subunit HadC [Mycobacterium sp.]|jgi:acyl dehydratase|nr:(3R)-hydroxyacyl-ACP dehydratase subunit HadC [Mycobacterium sp.]
MAIKTDVLGMVFDYEDYFVIGREKIREYARAVKSFDPASHDEAAAAELGHAGLVAPLTFISTLALIMQQDFFRKVDTGFTTMQIVQVDQKFLYHKPFLAGDKVWGRMEVISVNERFGADIVVTRNLALDENGELYIEAYTTLMGHEGDDSISLKYDEETGQVTRTPTNKPAPSETPGAVGEAKAD